MEYQTAPIGTYIYDEKMYSEEKARDIIEESLGTDKIILCRVVGYDKESQELQLIFHGNKGVIRSGHISTDKNNKVDYFIGKTIGVHITKILRKERIFVGSRLGVEDIARVELEKYQIGDVVEGVVKKVIPKKQCAFVDLKEGRCAYLDLKSTSFIPNTACSIDEFVKEGERIKAKITYKPVSDIRRSNNTIRISLVELEGNFEERCKEYKIESVIEGKVREDKMLKDVYYMVINQYLYIRFKSERNFDLTNTIKIVIKKYNLVEKCIEGEVEGENVRSSKRLESEIVGYGCSMFQLKAKGTVSPFAIRREEEWRFESERVNGISMESIQNKYRNGHINIGHCNILIIIGSLGFCTSKQILSYAYSRKINLELTTQNKLKVKTDSLQKVGLIDISRFEGEEEKGIYRVFNITKLGEQFLRHYLYQKKVIYSDKMFLLSTDKVKKILAVNQFSLACMEKISNFLEAYYHQFVYGIDDVKIRTNSTLDFQTCSIFLEAVRNKENSLEEIREKLERYEKLFSNLQAVSLNSKNPRFVKNRELFIVLICENYEQCLEIKNMVDSMYLSKYLFFTHDLQIFQGDVEFSIYRIDENAKLRYYSLLDLIKNGRECYTEDIVIDNNLSNHRFNSFPEAWLEKKEVMWNELVLDNIQTSDVYQNINCFVRKEYKRFLETSKIARNNNDSEILWEPRLFFFGSGGAGKTSLIKLLAGQSFNSEEKKTHGVQFLPNLFKNLPWMQIDGKKIENIQVWDFAGQGCDHVLTNFLMADDALCIVVMDSRKEEYPDEWLRYIQMYSPNAKILLVLNKVDSESTIVQGDMQRKCFNFDFASYVRMYNNIEGIYKISCKDPGQCMTDLMCLESDICKLIFSMENQIKDTWVKGIHSLRDWMYNSENGFIYKNEFIKKHKELGLDRVDVQSTLELCVKAGICIHRKSMGKVIVLKPEWLTSALAKILLSDDFISKKWQLTYDEIVEILEGEKYQEIYKYEEGEGEALIDLMERLEICVKSDNKYIFPCFLPYYSDSKSVDQIIRSANWYEMEVRYQYLPPDIFPKLQANLWNSQWNILYEYNPNYEPDKGKIIVEINNRKIMVYKKDNSIVFALERRVTEDRRLENDGREAIQIIREKLKKINIEQGLELEDRRIKNDKVQEYVIITSNDLSNTETQKISYAKKLLKRICLKGINEQYFPEIDSFYDPKELLLAEFSTERIKDIYMKYVVSMYKTSSWDETFEDSESILLGSGFLILYKEKWYVTCCAHECTKNEEYAYFVKIQNMSFQLSYINSTEKGNLDIALFQIEERFYKYKNLLPEELLSFQTKGNTLDEVYCCGYIQEDRVTRKEGMQFVRCNEKTGNLVIKINSDKNLREEIDEDFNDYIHDGMSGSPILNLENRCMIGMLLGTRNNAALAMNMDHIWEFVKESVNNIDEKGDI